jgi:hypothetical protein
VSPVVVVPVMLMMTIMLLDSVSLEIVLQPINARTAAATASVLRVTDSLFMARSLLLLDDPGSDENQ